MPRMMNDDMETGKIAGGQGFTFSAVRIESLGATEYTLVTIAIDVTGSVDDFKDGLLKCLRTAVQSCKDSPKSYNILLRVILFSTSKVDGIEELHGFKLVSEIDPKSYPELVCGGGTPLYDAVFSVVGATMTYSKKLMSQEYRVNSINFIITDGDDNASRSTINMIKKEIDRGKNSEEIESMINVLIGINASMCTSYLDNLAQGTGMKYIDAGDATKGKLAKLAEFVSQSVSSQSQSLGTGGPSQNIAATI